MSLVFEGALAQRGFSAALRVDDGETVVVLGPNGAGKSTLLGLLAGTLRADSGRAVLDDTELFSIGPESSRVRAAHRRGITLLAQDALLFPHLTVRENVAFGPRSARVGRSRAREIAEEWLSRAGVADLATRHPRELSGGQAQRVAIARALASAPRLMLLDEPMASLDVAASAAVRALLSEVIPGRSTVIVTHDVIDAYALADRVVVFDGGRIVDEGTTAEVLDRPATGFAARLAGLELLGANVTPSGLRTDSGVPLAVDHSVHGGRAWVAVPSSRVVIADRSVAPDADTTLVPGLIAAIEPRGDIVRIGIGELAAEVPVRTAARLRLRIGDPVALTFRRADALAYPERPLTSAASR